MISFKEICFLNTKILVLLDPVFSFQSELKLLSSISALLHFPFRTSSHCLLGEIVSEAMPFSKNEVS